MTIADMILYLRQQLLSLRSDNNNRQMVAELLATFKMLTRAAFNSGDDALVALLVDLTDSTRDMYMGKPLNGRFPSEEKIREVAGKHAFMAMAAAPLAMPPQPLPATDTSTVPTIEEPPTSDEDTGPIRPETIQLAIREAEDERRERREAVITLLTRLRGHNWHNHDTIRDGTAQQMRAYSTVYDELAVFMKLKEHKPMWVGTYPIDLDIAASDIDIIFSPPNLRRFLVDVRDIYGHRKDFKVVWQPIKQVPSIVVQFMCEGFPIELFAQPRPITRQDAYVHMVVEARLLAIGGEKAHNVIRELKQNGMSTELAFTSYFNINGTDPYAAMLELANTSDEALVRQFLR